MAPWILGDGFDLADLQVSDCMRRHPRYDPNRASTLKEDGV